MTKLISFIQKFLFSFTITCLSIMAFLTGIKIFVTSQSDGIWFIVYVLAIVVLLGVNMIANNIKNKG